MLAAETRRKERKFRPLHKLVAYNQQVVIKLSWYSIVVNFASWRFNMTNQWKCK